MTSFVQPTLSLPPLYFNECRAPNTYESTKKNDVPELPAEIFSLCFTKYANWGDLSKLACVQKSWSNILTDAADQSIDTKWQLAQALMDGTCGLEKNPKRAISVARQLANIEIDENNDIPKKVCKREACYAPAMTMIANSYFEGNGVDKESKMGLAWLKAAFEMGKDLNAAFSIALTYEYGHHGVEVDVVAAAEWFRKAAEEGHVESMSELGLCYELGCGVEQSDEDALDWYTKAANLGHVTSKFSVGEAFEEARGVPQSDEEACLWYYRAALAGDEDSVASLRRLYDIARIVVPGVAQILNE